MESLNEKPRMAEMPEKKGIPGPGPEEHFLRGQIRFRKASGRLSGARVARLLLVAILSASAVAAVGIAFQLGGGADLEIDRILVEGNDRLSEGEILELVEVKEATNILTLDLDETKRKLLRSAWVKDVEVKRMLPATLTLEIVERTPVAVAALSELYLLAEDGTILDQLPPFYDMGKLILVRGLADGGGVVSTERAALAGRMAESLLADERLWLWISELDVSGGSDSVTLRLRDSPLAVLVSEATMMPRLSEVVPLLEGIEERLPRMEVLDLRFVNRVYVRLTETLRGETQGSNVPVPGGAPF
ncbi:MAG TPA: FtsQ-type POTRA domain-containing protein [Vicinamibacteria bacterium]|nr:FtsQ-type POTRA domain-containing protein [Vicinamibacteria bacterium]